MDSDRPKPRVLRVIELPPEVIASIQKVQQLIQERDEATLIPCDDSIQVGCLDGGLMEDGSNRFYFSVHRADNDPYWWEIALTHDEIARISSGEVRGIQLWCCAAPECDFKTYREDETCHWCDYGADRTPRRRR
jgi:ssDNA-binding Zn-finger/Zn-ribbon topoisomerase 1